MKRIPSLVAAFVLALCLLPARADDAVGRPVKPEFFGLHMHQAADIPWPDVPFKAWRLWDARVQWPHVQPQPNKWDFRALDKLVLLARNHGVEVQLPLGLSPSWASARQDESSAYQKPGWAAEPRDIEDWRTYVRTVAERYKGEIHIYEIWNEPNLTRFFSGTPAALSKLTCEAYKIIKQVDPAAIVVSPSATEKEKGVAWLQEFLAQGAAPCFDVVGFHFYMYAHETPELIAVIAGKIRDVMRAGGIADRPLWNTESGWYFANKRVANPSKYRTLDGGGAAAYVLRSFAVAASAGVERFYWYSWDNKMMGGLVEPDTFEPKPSAKAYTVAAQWLTGARVRPCVSGGDGVTTCPLTRADGTDAVLAWAVKGTKNWTVPAGLRGRKVDKLDTMRGEIAGSTAGDALALDEMPVLIHP